MDNRSEFLNNVAQALGRPLRLEPQAEDAPLNNYANERLTQLTQQQRCDAFIQFASDVMLTRCELTSEAKAAEAAIRLCKELGDQSVVISGDTRLEELGISERLQQECNAVVWDPAKGIENISQAEQAKVGVVYAEYGLTESGGVVLFSAAGRGRSLSLLPESSLFILRKSTILPRVAQLAEKLHHNRKDLFLREAMLLKQSHSLCSSMTTEQERHEAAYMEAVRSTVVKITYGGSGGKTLSLKEINAQINELLKASIQSQGVISLFDSKQADENISLFDPAVLDEISKMKEKNIAVEILKKLMAREDVTSLVCATD